MPQITSGRVVFSRTVQPAQFESKRSEVELSFVLAEGEELGKTLEDIGVLVKAEALKLVGLDSQSHSLGRREERDPDRRR